MKKEKLHHLVFYDGTCGFCDSTVQKLLKVDKHQQFVFASLQGKTAALMLLSLPQKFKGVDSLILIEDYKTYPKTYIQAKAVFRIFWLLGGLWTPLGVLSVLPSILMDWAYRLVARHRYLLGLKTNSCPVPSKGQENRFLE